jgi:hypothetical protein
MAFAAAVEVLRVVVNAPCSQGAAGFETHLAPSFTIGTGFFGRSSIGENVGPQHLVHWTRIAYNKDPAEAMGDFTGLSPRRRSAGSAAVPRTAARPASGRSDPSDIDLMRDEIRRIVLDELRAALKE